MVSPGLLQPAQIVSMVSETYHFRSNAELGPAVSLLSLT
jgi:hypothetical protein